MKVFKTSLNGIYIDGVINNFFNQIGRQGIEYVTEVEQCNMVFIGMSYIPAYTFNEAVAQKILDGKKPIVIFDIIETGYWSIPWVLGYNLGHIAPNNPEFCRMEEFFSKNLIPLVRMYFKREYCESIDKLGISFPITTFEFSALWPQTDSQYKNPQTKEQFDDRPINIFMVWGWSNSSRAILHGELIKSVVTHAKDAKALVTDERQITLRDCKGKVVVLFTPAPLRIPFQQMLDIQGQSKLSVCMNGSGEKCFRHIESPCNSVMAVMYPIMKWTYPWVDGENCIYLPIRRETYTVNGVEYFRTIIDEKEAVNRMYQYLKDPILNNSLHGIYLNGLKTYEKYRVDTYGKEHILKKIGEAQ